MNNVPALTKWSRLARSPTAAPEDVQEAWEDYIESVHKLRKAAPTEDDWSRRLRGALNEELAKVPRDRILSPAEFEMVIQRVATRAGRSLGEEWRRLARRTYAESAQRARNGVGLRLPTNFALGPHAVTLATIDRGEGLAETFSRFGAELSAHLREIVVDAYRRGSVDPGRISQTMIDEAGWGVRWRLDRIARSETAKVENAAFANTMEEAEKEFGEAFLYGWVVTEDELLCPICKEIERRVGDGVPMNELKRIISEVSRDPTFGGRPTWNPTRDSSFPYPHPNDRCAPIRRVK